MARAVCITSSWVSSRGCKPAARFAMQEIPATRSPAARARTASGTVDMPTASAPRLRSSRTSAGVSYVGPVTAAYTPRRTGRCKASKMSPSR